MDNKLYGYSSYQQKKAAETIAKVRFAITKLIDEGALISKPRLVKETGLSRAVFDKPHVHEVLKEFGICEYEKTAENQKQDSQSTQELIKKIERLEKENLTLKEQIEKLRGKSNRYQADFLETKEAYQYLLGEWHLLLTKARLKGLEIDESMIYKTL